jgi:hypothetical protein
VPVRRQRARGSIRTQHAARIARAAGALTAIPEIAARRAFSHRALPARARRDRRRFDGALRQQRVKYPRTTPRASNRTRARHAASGQSPLTQGGRFAGRGVHVYVHAHVCTCIAERREWKAADWRRHVFTSRDIRENSPLLQPPPRNIDPAFLRRFARDRKQNRNCFISGGSGFIERYIS